MKRNLTLLVFSFFLIQLFILSSVFQTTGLARDRNDDDLDTTSSSITEITSKIQDGEDVYLNGTAPSINEITKRSRDRSDIKPRDAAKPDLLPIYPEDYDVESIHRSSDRIPGDRIPGLSNIERIISGRFPAVGEETLRQFGYDVFEKRESMTPERAVPVGSDYIIGPDDQFTINLWGRTEGTHQVVVSRDGTITLARLGTLHVGGMKKSEMETFLENKFKEYYPDFEMSINMSALRTVDVFIIGEMDEPGTYALNSLSTVISALFASGGPNKNGSLRNIRVFEDSRHIKTIDLYDFFISGAKSDDIRLRQGQTIFIPVIGPTVGISGNVRRPAIYELKGKQTLGDLFNMAGGILPSGHIQNVVVERIVEHKRRVINSFNLDPEYPGAPASLKTILQDGDHIKIYPVYKSMEQVVFLEGHVKYPREHELKEEMRLSDIIPSFDYLLPEPFLPHAEIMRLVPPNLHPEIVAFDLGALLSGDEKHNLLLHNRDRVIVYSEAERRDMPEVMISGLVRNPGTYRLFKGMTVKDLIFRSGNISKTAFMERADLTRILPGTKGSDTIKMSFNPEKALEGDPEHNLALQADDQVFIREIPRYRTSLARRITLEGEFLFPGVYTFSEGERLSSVIERAGGLTNNAFPFGAAFLRDSVREIQRERYREYINRLEQDILTISALAAETSLDQSQAATAMMTLNAKQELIDKLRESEPTGRMVINLSEAVLVGSSASNIELRAGDRLLVGKQPDFVHIIGDVYNPNALLAERGKTVGDYLNLVGGLTNSADKKQIYIVKADGTVISRKQGRLGIINWDSTKHRWAFGRFNSIKVEAGDTIIVPKKLHRSRWLRVFRDTTSVFYELAVSAGVLHTLFSD